MVIVVLAVLGLCFGSFVNALVWRLHNKKDWVKERSECVHCHYKLAPIDLIPVLSWLALAGKCRYCKKPISWQYPLIELLTAGLFVLSYLQWLQGFSAAGTVQFILWLGILTGAVALFLYDLKWLLLPDKIVYPLVILAVIHAAIAAFKTPDLADFFFSLAASLVLSSGVFYALFQLSGGKWIGGGDVKFGLVYGFLLADPLKSTLVLFLASILGSLAALPLLFAHRLKAKSVVPFGPFLIVAMIVIYLWGDPLINWYMHQLLLV